MSIIATWGGKSWEVSSHRVAALNGLSTSVELDTEINDDKAGSPATKTKALKLQTFNFDFDLAAVVGCDVRGEYESWTTLVGHYAPFYLAGRRFGPANLQLTGVSISDVTLDDFGRMLRGNILITLTEYAEEASSKKTSPCSAINYAAGVSNHAVPRLSAVGIGASTQDKAVKKPQNIQLTREVTL